MKKIYLEGGYELNGELVVQGAKNAVLPILAGTLLAKGTTIIDNVPDISDVRSTVEILKVLGCKVERDGKRMFVDSTNITNCSVPESLMREMRSSVILLGAILGRCKEGSISFPGGCEIGPRPIDIHLSAFEKLGVKIENEHGNLKCKWENFEGQPIYLKMPSVGATENIILLATLAKGVTRIYGAACEPEIVDLQNFLNKMGAKISGAGSSMIEIEGVESLSATEYRIMPDRIVAATYLCAVAMCGGEIVLNDVRLDHMRAAIDLLEQSGCNILTSKNSVKLRQQGRPRSQGHVQTMPYPGFPTDMQAIFLTLATIAQGNSVFVETIFQNRFKHVSELIRMGAKIKLDGRIAVVEGVKKLNGAPVVSTDLRGGAAMVLAGLSAQGRTEIGDIAHIMRGYDSIDKHISELGGRIWIG